MFFLLILAILVYFKEIRKADEALTSKRSKIEQELPRFVATITQELKASRDVLSMPESFKKNAGAGFASELIGVLRGDDGAMYFQMLTHDMKQLELQQLKAQAQKIPPKIRVFSFLMLMCFMMTYMTIIVFEIITSLSGMF